MRHYITLATTPFTRRQPFKANTFGVFARVLPRVLVIFNTLWRGAGHLTQFGERVASLITRPAVNGGEGASGFARPAPRCGCHRTALKASDTRCFRTYQSENYTLSKERRL
jgi:hypothetical protein